jgi:hypothetical protein
VPPWLEPVIEHPRDAVGPRYVRLDRSSLPPPVICLPDPGGEWRLEQPYTYLDNDVSLTVPAGFRFDLSSVPRFLWPLVAPFELSIAAPLLHDFLYRHGGAVYEWTDPPEGYTRWGADRVFREVMALEGVPDWRRRVAWAAVRCFGWGAWRS